MDDRTAPLGARPVSDSNERLDFVLSAASLGYWEIHPGGTALLFVSELNGSMHRLRRRGRASHDRKGRRTDAGAPREGRDLAGEIALKYERDGLICLIDIPLTKELAA